MFPIKTVARCLIALNKCDRNVYRRTRLSCARFSSQKLQAKVETEDNTKLVNKFVNRTHTCGELRTANVNENVKLCGWLQFRRMGNFIILRDSYGSTQCIIDKENLELMEQVKNLGLESVLSVSGTVVSRPKDQCNKKMETGDIEVLVESVTVLNPAKSHLPFNISDYNKAKESLQMEYRYLALRFPTLQRNLRVRSWVTMKTREYLINKCGFVDVATPTLFRKTPGGAQEFIVPTKHVGKFYSLVQSPQQFKQLLMVGGIDRYFQFAQCYRDEGSRNDRQPEFTQLDIEMSFIEREDIMSMSEKLIVNSWPDFLENLETPFPSMTYEVAMETYGSDCPDLRLPGRIHQVPIVRENNDDSNEPCNAYVTVFHKKKQYLTTSVQKKLSILSKQWFSNVKLVQLKVSDLALTQLSNWFSECVRKDLAKSLELTEDDILFVTYGLKADARQLLGKIRVEFADIIESKGECIRSVDNKFLWIIDFPLFALNKETHILETNHHPFTHPHPEDMEFLSSDPLKVRGLQYDLVFNGSEIGGGSIRIHQRNLQEKILEMLNIDPSHMYYLLEALDSGAPPHGGIALGMDRYISMICNASSIREVIAFPKTMEGRDLMSGAPTQISEKDKKLYNINIVDNSQD